MPETFYNNTRREPAYYSAVLHILIACSNKSMTYPQTAAALNEGNLTTPTGNQWSGESLKQLFKKLRNYKTSKSFVGQHLLELVFEQKLSLKEVLPLFQNRRDK